MSANLPIYPFTWPNGARVCVTPSVVLELWSEDTTPGANLPPGFISGNVPLQGGKKDLRAQKMIEYGGKVGMWRLLEILDREHVLASVIANGRAVEVYDDVVLEFHRRGHEIVAHSYAQDLSTYDFENPEEERENIRRSVDVIQRVTGERPKGWISPRATPSEHTLRLLVEEGFTWCGDYPDDELPYVLEVCGRPIAVLPYSGTAGVNDYEIALIQGNPPSVYVEEFRKTMDYLREEQAITGRPGMIRISVHAHVYGRPWGRYAFRDAIRYAKSFPDVWFTTRAKLADWVLQQYATQRDRLEAMPGG